jgi:hypothetical protein
MQMIPRYETLPLVVPRETLVSGWGGKPTVNVTGISPGGDWNSGKVFVYTEYPMAVAGEEFEKERAEARAVNEKLGWIWYVAAGIMSPEDKVKAILKVLKDGPAVRVPGNGKKVGRCGNE